ncbi:hypothetical protein PV327_002038 [Microctonus hyperodae]|uniref:Amino acid transporter transmembrane domain-containing protein n=1 Tax=Microctonus hyperodae TaxID=165561 RepID=A0AA39FET1_MICHY|nr:hypothetical protein PV327_002038 [Microctonus hyperodae]
MPGPNELNKYSARVGAIFIFNLIVGTGALTLPAVFSRAGWALGTCIILILGFMSFVTLTFVIESMASANAIITWQRIQNRKRERTAFEESENEPSNSDSEDTPLFLQPGDDNPGRTDITSRYYLIDNKVEMGEMASMFFNKFGTILFYVCLATYLYGDLSIYAAAIGKSMVDVACTYRPLNLTCNDTINSTEICWEGAHITRVNAYQLFLTTFVSILGSFVFFDIQKTKYLQVLTSAMRWLAFAIMIIYALRILIISGAQASPSAANWLGIPGLFGACVYSFMCHHSLPALIVPIADKSMLNRFLLFDYTLIASFYLLLALSGSFAFKHLDDLYTLDFGPRGAGDCSTNTNIFMIIIEYFLALFPVFTLSTSFPIIAITLRNNLQSLFFYNLRDYNFCLRKLVFPFMAVIPPYIIAMSVDDLSTLVKITGSYAGVGIQYLVPTCLVYYARNKTTSTIGLGVKNKFASPFIGTYWLIFVIVWAITCMILVSINFIGEHIGLEQSQ